MAFLPLRGSVQREYAAQSGHLVVHQRVHRIQDDSPQRGVPRFAASGMFPDAGARIVIALAQRRGRLRPAVSLFQDTREDGQDERFRLARSGSGGYEQIAGVAEPGEQRFLLMRVQRESMQRQSVFHELRQARGDDFGMVALQVAQAARGGEGGGGFYERILRRDAARPQKRRPLAEYERMRNPVLRFDVARQRLSQMRRRLARRELHIPLARIILSAKKRAAMTG